MTISETTNPNQKQHVSDYLLRVATLYVYLWASKFVRGRDEYATIANVVEIRAQSPDVRDWARHSMVAGAKYDEIAAAALAQLGKMEAVATCHSKLTPSHPKWS